MGWDGVVVEGVVRVIKRRGESVQRLSYKDRIPHQRLTCGSILMNCSSCWAVRRTLARQRKPRTTLWILVAASCLLSATPDRPRRSSSCCWRLPLAALAARSRACRPRSLLAISASASGSCRGGPGSIGAAALRGLVPLGCCWAALSCGSCCWCCCCSPVAASVVWGASMAVSCGLEVEGSASAGGCRLYFSRRAPRNLSRSSSSCVVLMLVCCSLRFGLLYPSNPDLQSALFSTQRRHPSHPFKPASAAPPRPPLPCPPQSSAAQAPPAHLAPA